MQVRSPDFFDRLESITADLLTRRCLKRRLKREKQKNKNIILDWLEAFLWAAGMVFLINQYLVQAYQIPSGSMIDTLLIGDRIFVNKIIFGPEILPGLGKLTSPVKPKRNDVIIFENPSYISQGVIFDIAQRVIYMLTLTFVDIDKDESGSPKAHFLIKRAVGVGGDRFVSHRGNLRVLFAGEDRWTEERDFIVARGMDHNLSRLLTEEDYPVLEARGRYTAYMELGQQPPAALSNVAVSARPLYYADSFALEKARLELLRAAWPQDSRYRAILAKLNQGWYVPEGRILPLGDNRDNSRDGRYFGPVKASRILGRGSIIYWPGNLSIRRPESFGRMGRIQ